MSAHVTLFTVEEADRLAAAIRPQLERLRALKQEFDRLETRIGVLRVAIAGATPGNPDTVELGRVHAQRATLAQEITAGLHAVQRQGCLVKDLDQGLVDFYALRGDRLVFLCWRLGEPHITHWHTLDGGYATRQPLDHSPLE